MKEDNVSETMIDKIDSINKQTVRNLEGLKTHSEMMVEQATKIVS